MTVRPLVGLGLAVILTLPAPVRSADGEAERRVTADTAVLEVLVPADATVSIDGKDRGRQRRFPFRPFPPGRQFSYDVRVRFKDGGVAERTVLLRAAGTSACP
jgi:uncharacterized protein (TIGR03000 family)